MFLWPLSILPNLPVLYKICIMSTRHFDCTHNGIFSGVGTDISNTCVGLQPQAVLPGQAVSGTVRKEKDASDLNYSSECNLVPDKKNV